MANMIRLCLRTLETLTSTTSLIRRINCHAQGIVSRPLPPFIYFRDEVLVEGVIVGVELPVAPENLLLPPPWEMKSFVEV
jgi:hypothetical protein